MNHPFLYVGCFFCETDLLEKITPYRQAPLARAITHPHITFAYQPETVDQSLFGADIPVTILGYANNGMNEGLRVSLHSEIPELQRMINKIPVPHITLSVSEGAKSVNTRGLCFHSIPAMRIHGTYGGFVADQGTVLHP